jgi:DNA-binding GntR family transcriptional regulator
VERVVITLEVTSLIDSLCDALRHQIIAGDIVPEQKVSELWVAERFNVARPTAKASLERLVNEGMLRRDRYKSAFVPRLSPADIEDIYLSREPVESLSVKLLAADRLVPPNAERALTLMTAAADLGHPADHTEADVALHRALVAATGSPRLRRMHETVLGETQLCIAQVRCHADVDLAALTDSHAAILAAIRSGDGQAAVVALQHDLHGCRDMLLTHLAERDSRSYSR